MVMSCEVISQRPDPHGLHVTAPRTASSSPGGIVCVRAPPCGGRTSGVGTGLCRVLLAAGSPPGEEDSGDRRDQLHLNSGDRRDQLHLNSGDRRDQLHLNSGDRREHPNLDYGERMI